MSPADPSSQLRRPVEGCDRAPTDPSLNRTAPQTSSASGCRWALINNDAAPRRPSCRTRSRLPGAFVLADPRRPSPRPSRFNDPSIDRWLPLRHPRHHPSRRNPASSSRQSAQPGTVDMRRPRTRTLPATPSPGRRHSRAQALRPHGAGRHTERPIARRPPSHLDCSRANAYCPGQRTASDSADDAELAPIEGPGSRPAPPRRLHPSTVPGNTGIPLQ
jgi:hypothetical protein